MTHAIDARTRAYGLLGHPVGHSLSPAMHNTAFAALGMNALYLAFDVAPGSVAAALRGMAALGFGGTNVTVPHKEEALRAVDRLDASAELVGAVNTVQFTPEGLVGYNTDTFGFVRAVREAFDFAPAGRRVFVVGAGGAGRAVALVCAREGAAEVTLADVDEARLARVEAELRRAAPGAVVRLAATRETQGAAAREADLVVQATPLGMKKDDPSPLPPEAFRAGARAFDLVYTSPETPFMRAARAGGAEAANGLGMLLYQGVKAFEIWTGVEPPAQLMRAVLEKAVYG